MFTLAYEVSKKLNLSNLDSDYDLSAASESDFYYSDIFVGNIYIKNDTADLSVNWEWVPILHFSKELSNAYVQLSGTKWSVIEFTENVDQILLKREGRNISIKSSYSSDELIVDYFDFGSAVVRFAENALKELRKNHPKAKRNITIKGYEDDLKRLKKFYKSNIKSSELVQ